MGINQQKLEKLHTRLFGEISAGYGGVMVALGDKLGLYKAMAGAGPLSSHEVARRSGCAERYVREWTAASTLADCPRPNDSPNSPKSWPPASCG